MKNVKRIAVFVIALVLISQVAFAWVDISGIWTGKISAVGYKFPNGSNKLYGIITGAKEGNIRIVVPNVGSSIGLLGTFRWERLLGSDDDLLVVDMKVPKLGPVHIVLYEDDVKLTKKGTKLSLVAELPKGLGPVQVLANRGTPKVKSISAGKAKAGVAMNIVVKTTIPTDYIVMTDKNDRVMGFTDTTSGVGVFNYTPSIPGKHVFRFYAGFKDGVGQIPVKAKVGDLLTIDDKVFLSNAKKLVKKVK